jgi:hypothetical protein
MLRNYSRIEVFFRPPPTTAIRDIYLTAFNKDLWVAIIFAWIIISMMITLFVRFRRQLLTTENPHSQMDEELSNNVVLWSVGAVSQQGNFIYIITMAISIFSIDISI